ncbi:MAG: hypothetical protein ACRYFL_07375 [Janthinobacterium lividum]
MSGFLSVHSILKELKNNEYQIIDVKELTIERLFQFILQYGQPLQLAEMFIRFARNFKLN